MLVFKMYLKNYKQIIYLFFFIIIANNLISAKVKQVLNFFSFVLFRWADDVDAGYWEGLSSSLLL